MAADYIKHLTIILLITPNKVITFLYQQVLVGFEDKDI